MLDIHPPSADGTPDPILGNHIRLSDREDPHADLDRLGNEIAELSAHIQAATYRLLVLIREFDARGGWGTGFRSCAHWLNWRTGLDLGAAREKVRVARALEDLPRISRAIRKGQLSYSKVRALTRVANPSNEAEVLEFALAGTAAHVETLVRAWRRVDRFAAMNDGTRIAEHRYLNTYTDEDGMLVIRGRLAPEVGAIFQKALEAAMEELFQRSREQEAPISSDGDDEPENSRATLDWSEIPVEQKRADALELLAEGALAGGLDPGSVGDRYQVVVHLQGQSALAITVDHPQNVSAETRHDDCSTECSAGNSSEPARLSHPSASLETGEDVSAETSRRLACEASRVVMTHDSNGATVDVGRKTRAIHPAMRRALNHRDGSCRFPGCNVSHCDAHHIEHWADGGETNLDNLLLLCRFHHRALHEGDYRIVFDSLGNHRFYTANGQPLPIAPQIQSVAADPEVELTRQNWRAGIEISAFTGLPSWHGEPVNYNYALDGLRGI